MKIWGTLIQARQHSTRLDAKVLAPIGDRPALKWLVDTARSVPALDTVAVVTGPEANNTELVAWLKENDIPYFCGNEEDVLDRMVQAAKYFGLDVVVRLTGDCPFLDPEILLRCLNEFDERDVDYVSNNHPPTWPDGYDVEVISTKALERAHDEAPSGFEREHVTPHIWRNRNSYSQHNLVGAADFSFLRLTLDEPADLECLRKIESHLGANATHFDSIKQLLADEPGIFEANRHIGRNEGLADSITGSLYRPADPRFSNSLELSTRAESLVPSQAQTFSKSPSQYVEGVSPRFLESAQGVIVTDVDGNTFIDTVMGLGPVTLGHANPEVDLAVMDRIRKGTALSLPSALEVDLAEALVDLIPSAEMVRFGKNGSDVTSAAVRAARAITGRDHIACSGYHGWQDWFIGTTTRARGVPEEVSALTHTFSFNDLESLQQVFNDHEGDIAAVVMEPMGIVPPHPGFLMGVRELCNKHGTVLVFDEIVTGFRIDLGGAQSLFGVTPDLTCLGKALGNGHPISAICGRQDIMEIFDNIFFSFTAAGDTAGLAAALKVIEIYRRDDVINRLRRNGDRFADLTHEALGNAGLSTLATLKGHPARTVLEFHSGEGDDVDLMCKSLHQQEMIKRGILTINANFMSLGHEGDAADRFGEAMNESLQVLKIALENHMLDRFLEGEPVAPVFRKP